eukprot:173720_1
MPYFHIQRLFQDKQMDNVIIRAMKPNDVNAADKVLRNAFNKFLGTDMLGDADYVYSRSQYATGCYVAEIDYKIVGSHFTTNWGSFQFRGPMSVDPAFQTNKIAHKLIDAVYTNMSSNANVRSYGLFTFPTSTKHLYLYNKKGFKPRYLTPILSKSVECSDTISHEYEYNIFDSKTFDTSYNRDELISLCKNVTNDIHKGLDVSIEINGVLDLGLGYIAIVRNKKSDFIDGFSIVHYGAGSEAGSNKSYIKFASCRNAKGFQVLLNVIELYSRKIGMKEICGGMNMGRDQAFDVMTKQCKYKYTPLIGVALERNSDMFLNSEYQGYNKSNVFIIDDWR